MAVNPSFEHQPSDIPSEEEPNRFEVVVGTSTAEQAAAQKEADRIEYRLKLYRVSQMIGKNIPELMELRPRRKLKDISKHKRAGRKFLNDL